MTDSDSSKGGLHSPRRRRGGRILLLCLSVVVLVFVGWVILGWSISSNQRVIRVEYIEQWNEPINAVPLEQQAWPGLRDALVDVTLRLPGVEEDALDRLSGEQLVEKLSGVLAFARLHREGTGSLEEAYRNERDAGLDSLGMGPEELQAWFGTLGPIMPRIHEACGRAAFGAPYGFGLPDDPGDRDYFMIPEARRASDAPGPAVAFPLLEIQLPHVAAVRRVGQLLAADAFFAAVNGDVDRALEDLAAMSNLGRLWADRMIIIEQLVGAANDRLLFETIDKILDHAADDLSDSDLERLAALLSPEEWGDRAFRFDAERANFQDLLQRTYSDDGNGDGVLLLRHLGAVSPVPVGESSFLSVLSQPIVNMYTVSRKEASALFEAHLGAVEVASGDPLHEVDWETLDRLQACMAPQSDSLRDKIRSFPMSLLAVDWTNLLASNQLSACELAALRVIVALHRQHRRSPDARWPETLEELDPDLLDSIPTDPYGGAPLRYGLVDGQPRLWSIGADRIDDGGLLPEVSCECDDRARRFQRPGTEVPDALRGDWILWRGPVRP